MDAYLAEVHKLEKHFLSVGLEHIPRIDNKDADDIARRASRKEPQHPGVFVERLLSPSAAPATKEPATQDELLPPPPLEGAPDCGLPSRDCLLMVTVHEGGNWITELKEYILKGTLPADNAEAERIARQIGRAHV